MTIPGITGYGAYIPRLRIARKLIADAHAWMAPSLRAGAAGHRAFCSWDEDAITMAVEAARDCLPQTDRQRIEAVSLASTTLPFADLQSSALVADALLLPRNVQSLDVTSSQRAGTSGLIQAMQSGRRCLHVASDRPVARPASAQELSFGAGAAAFAIGTEGILAELLSTATVTVNFVDHFRAATSQYDYCWEERWVRDEGIVKLMPAAAREALERAGLVVSDVNCLVVPPLQRGAAKAVAAQLGFNGPLADELTEDCGYTGAAHALLMLARVLESANPGEVILVLGFGQGADAILLRATESIRRQMPPRGITGSMADRLETDSYLRLLSFYDNIALDWGMRSERECKTMLSTQYRAHGQIAGFVAGRCTNCGSVQFPKLQYCVNPECRASASDFEDVSLADESSRVFTFTNDWLFYYPAPPLRIGFMQFDNGARLPMEMVDVGSDGIEVGMPMRQVFRIKDIDKERGFRRYFWKATPVSVSGR